MSTVSMSLDAIYALAHDTMTANGCDEANAAALADIVMRAERDGSHSHGLFRVPGYVKALRSGKVYMSTGMAALHRWRRLSACRCSPRRRQRLVLPPCP